MGSPVTVMDQYGPWALLALLIITLVHRFFLWLLFTHYQFSKVIEKENYLPLTPIKKVILIFLWVLTILISGFIPAKIII